MLSEASHALLFRLVLQSISQVLVVVFPKFHCISSVYKTEVQITQLKTPALICVFLFQMSMSALMEHRVVLNSVLIAWEIMHAPVIKATLWHRIAEPATVSC